MMFQDQVMMTAFPEFEERKEVGIVSLEFAVYDEYGVPRGIDYIYVHHFGFLQMDSSALPCVDDWVLLGTGAELSDTVLPSPYVYAVNTPAQWYYLIDLMIMMPHDLFHPDMMSDDMSMNITRYARVEMKIKYVELGENASQYKPVRKIILNINGCSASTDFDVIQDGNGNSPTTTFSWEFISNFTGTIVAAAGHLHTGGVSIRMVQMIDGQPMTIFQSLPTYKHGELVAMSRGEPMIHVTEGTPMRLEAVYSNVHSIEGAMALMAAYIHLGPPEMTDPSPQQSPLYDTPTKSPISLKLAIVLGAGVALVAVVAIVVVVLHYKFKTVIRSSFNQPETV